MRCVFSTVRSLGLLMLTAANPVLSADGPSANGPPEDGTEQIPQLIAALSDSNLRYGASVTLTRLGADAVPALQQSLVSGEGDVPVWSAYTLGQIGTAAFPAAGDLIAVLSDSDDALRAAAAKALGKIGPSDDAATQALTSLLADPKHTVRLNVAVSLGQIGPSAVQAVPKLIDALVDSRLRTAARTSLIQIGSAAVPQLLKQLDNAAVRFDVCVILKQVDPEKAEQAGLNTVTAADVPSCRLVLADSARPAEERADAATVLASAGKEGVAVLTAALEDRESARIAAKAFAEVGADGVPALIAVLDHTNREVCCAAVDAVGHIGPPAADAAAPHLIRLLKDDNRDVRYHAVRALHTFGRKAAPAVPAVTEVIQNVRESEPTRQWAIKTLLVTLPETHDVVVKALIEASKDKGNYGVSQLARQEVRRIDPKAAEAAGVR